MEIREIGRRKASVVDKVKAKELMEKMRKDHSKMVKGKFEFIDAQGGWLEFNYRIFPEDLLVSYKFIHGETCEIPMGLVRHLNNTKKKIRSFGVNNSIDRSIELPNRGLPSTFDTTSRVRFTPIEMF